MWGELCGSIEQVYGAQPKIEYSQCSGMPGWNVKYKKSGKALCTLYPAEGFFVCLVVAGDALQNEIEGRLLGFEPYTAELYRRTPSSMGSRWLMIELTSAAILRDVQELIALRIAKGKKPS